ncbi:MAG: NAD(P)/FAD-dependent oxidoreductase, partial [Acidimicrobiia bacterium]|nr:NAD(P)/FAD-dependent oxidoreductase [Acidimicrobiia bacterium]
MTRPDFDAVVAGAGHNGLIAACYLARSGMDVLVVEARDTVGGLASTVDALGARVNICMCDHVMIRSTPIIEELDLVAQGLTYVDVDPHHLYLSGDPTAAWFGFHDVEQTAESLAIVHPGAAAGYRRLMDRALPVARLVLDLACEVPTPGASLKALGRHGVSAVSTMLGWARRSALDVLASAGADDVAGMLLAGAPSTWGLPPRHPRTGLAVLSAAVRHAVMPGRPVGGSGALSGSIASRLASVGGKVRCGVSVESVLVESRRVRGVGLSDGSVIEAPVVVCAADPRR